MKRQSCVIKDIEIQKEIDYSKQYFYTYCSRLESQSNVLISRLTAKFGPAANIRKIADIVKDEECIIVGVLYKEMDQKPSVLKELSDSNHLDLTTVNNTKLISKTDYLCLEDAQQRIQLSWNASHFVTGIVCALRGVENEENLGKFNVNEVYYATPEFPLLKNLEISSVSQFIVLISGLEVSAGNDLAMRLHLFFDWICGGLKLDGVAVSPTTIGRIILAGNSWIEPEHDNNQNNLSSKKVEISTESLSILDQLISRICKSIPVDIMPGQTEPVSQQLPQKPLHKILFSNSRKWNTFNTRPNPWTFFLDNGAYVLGTSGETVDDVIRCSAFDDPLDAMDAMIKWGHAGPTIPDTLTSYPNIGVEDPLVLIHHPTLYFAGNQQKMAWKNIEHDSGNTILVTVPKFKDSFEVVLVDLLGNSCRSVKFG